MEVLLFIFPVTVVLLARAQMDGDLAFQQYPQTPVRLVVFLALKEGLRHWLDVLERRRRQRDLSEAMGQSEDQIRVALTESLPSTY
nr:unnamed protein product [Spirometra erinaceieuropaei]